MSRVSPQLICRRLNYSIVNKHPQRPQAILRFPGRVPVSSRSQPEIYWYNLGDGDDEERRIKRATASSCSARQSDICAGVTVSCECCNWHQDTGCWSKKSRGWHCSAANNYSMVSWHGHPSSSSPNIIETVLHKIPLRLYFYLFIFFIKSAHHSEHRPSRW